jgi:hypothetical protein
VVPECSKPAQIWTAREMWRGMNLRSPSESQLLDESCADSIGFMGAKLITGSKHENALHFNRKWTRFLSRRARTNPPPEEFYGNEAMVPISLSSPGAHRRRMRRSLRAD